MPSDNPSNSSSNKNISIGGDVNGIVIVGDNNVANLYKGDYVSLKEYYIPPDSVFQRVRTADFVGRDWLTAKVDAFLNDSNRKSGAFLLIGDAGVGKTSFMAHLVKERGYLHLFAEQAPGQAMLQRAMQSLASQLVTRYQIDPYKDRDSLNALSVFPNFLERILRLAASTLTEGEKIVIVCDALNEAGTFPDHFVFGLPKELPDGVYFILSQRPVNVKLPNFEPMIEKLEAQGEGNLQDIETYLSAVAKRPEVAGQIRSKEYSEDFFIQTLKEKSQGVWMYLHYIIKEIESGARAPLDLANLPTGLVGYYAEYWDAWRTGKRGKGEEAWDELYAPLLTTLAAAQEAIPVAWLIQWADVTAKPREVTRLLTEHWRAFITEKEKDGKKAYAPYHLSFKDFITSRVDTSKLPPAQANLVKDLASQTVDTHKRIASAFEKECDGEWEKLVEQEYPRLHLTAHLNGAGEYEKLRILLTEGDEKIKWAEAREKKEETYAGYLNDLTYVWDYAEREQNYALAIRCMLIENSIHSLASNIPPELLVELANAGIWSYSRCLSIIKQNTDPVNQAKSIELLAPNLPSSLFQEAITIAHKIEDKAHSSHIDFDFPLIFGKELEIKTITAKNQFKFNFSRAHALITLTPHLTQDLKKWIFVLLEDIQDSFARALSFSAVSKYFEEDLKIKALQNIISAARETKDLEERVSILSNLSPYLTEKQNAQVFYEILSIADNIYNISAITESISSLFPYLSEDVKSDAYFYICKSDFFKDSRIILLSNLVPYLNAGLKKIAIQECLNSIKIDGWEGVQVLQSIIPHLDQDTRLKALNAAHLLKKKEYRVLILSKISASLDKARMAQTLQDSLSIARGIKDEFERAYALYILIPYFDKNSKEEILNEALHAARNIGYKDKRIRMMLTLALCFDGDLRIKTLQDVLSLTIEITNNFERARILATIVPYLNKEQKSKVIQATLVVSQKIEDTEVITRFLFAVSPYLDNRYRKIALQEAISKTKKMSTESSMVFAVSDYAPFLNEDQKVYALSSVRLIKEEKDRIHFLKALAPHLNEDLIAESYDSVLRINNADYRFQVLLILVPYLNEEKKTKIYIELLRIIRNSRYLDSSVKSFLKLAPHISENQKKFALKEILSALDTNRHFHNRVNIFSLLAPHLDKSQIAGTLREALFASNLQASGFEKISSFAPFLNEEQKAMVLQKALPAIEKITDPSKYADRLSFLAPYLSEEQKIQAVSATTMIRHESNRTCALLRIASFSNRRTRIDIYRKALFSMKNLPDVIKQWEEIAFDGMDANIFSFFSFLSQKERKDGADILRLLIPALIHFSGPEIADELYRTITDVTRWWP